MENFERGKNFFLTGNFLLAAQALHEHLKFDPLHAESHHLIALVHHNSGEFLKAVEWFERTIAIQSKVGEYWANYGNTLETLGHKDRSMECYKKAIECAPNSADINANYSTMHWHRQNLDAALHYAVKAVAINPKLPSALYAKGNACKDLGLIDDALWSYQQAKRTQPGILPLESGYLYALNYHPDLSPHDIATEHFNWANQFANKLSLNVKPFRNALDRTKRLRIGYVSSAFRDHAINFFVEPMLKYHDRRECEVFCYSDVMHDDEVTQRLKSYVDCWRHSTSLSDDQLFHQIREDNIDILVDLHGHMSGLRLLVFARRAAPIQITYLGYQATTGMTAMDYRLTDSIADPDGATEHLHSEKLLRMPDHFFCYQPPDESPAITDSPLVRNGFVRFGSFNAANKLSNRVLDMWGKILHAVPTSKLRILVPDAPSMHERIGVYLVQAGAKAAQIEFVIRTNRRRYLERIAEVDIALDPFPFNGHTTSCDALWMGVPVLMRLGNSYVQRYGSSALVALGLDNLIARSDDEYVLKAVQLASNMSRLRKLRSSLRSRMSESKLMNYEAFSASLCQSYRSVWENYVTTHLT